MILKTKIKDHLFLPVLLVIFIISIENILQVLFEFLKISIREIDVNLLLFSDEFLHLVTTAISKGMGILVLILLMNFKVQGNDIELHSSIRVRNFLIIAGIIYVGCISFLSMNFNSSLLILSETSEFIKVWPEILMSRKVIESIDYQLLLILLLFVIIPVFEELLYRKMIIQALLIKRLKAGWIIIISSMVYAISPFFINLVVYSEEQATFDLLIQLLGGVILAIVFLKTQKIRYPVLLKILVNLTIYFDYLTMFHPLISQLREFYNISIFVIISVGIFLLFFIVIDGIVTIWSSSSLPSWLVPLADFKFYKNIHFKSIVFNILIFLPLIPFGGILFIDHTILFNDFGGSLVRIGLKSILLWVVIFMSGMQIYLNHSLFEAYPEPNGTIKQFIKDYYPKVLNNYPNKIRDIPRTFRQHFGIIILFLGVISPIIFMEMSATVFTNVPVFGNIFEVNMDMKFGQNPFLSYSRTSISSRIKWLPIPDIYRTSEEMFYILKHTNGQWYFLPDTFMSGDSDWFHGLITVGTWFLFLFLLYFTVHCYFQRRKVLAGILVIATVATELLWYLFTAGLGSVTMETGPPPPSTNQTISDFIKMDFEMNHFVFLPLGIFILFLAAIVFLLSGFINNRQEKKKEGQDQTNEGKSKGLEDLSLFSTEENKPASEERQNKQLMDVRK
ncbi:MAG: lysostaphin resistance A-like protein [Promethearchaeota archaeon]